MSKSKIILIGGGGHCISCIDVLNSTGQYEVVGIIDNALKLGSSVCGVKVIGTDNDIAHFCSLADEFLITVGQIKSGSVRRSLYSKCLQAGARPALVVSPKAYVSAAASLELGTIVLHGAIINAGAKIGANCIINTRSIIEHDVIVGDNCHISTGAICNGGVVVGDEVFVGSASVLVQGITIGKNVVIGAGSVVIRNVLDSETVVGNPAKKI